MIRVKCLACGERTTDYYADTIGGLAPAECERCGEEVRLLPDPLTYISVCAGIEAASVAWHPRGWEPVLFSEIETFPRAVLAHHYPAVPLVGDFTELLTDPPKADLLVGGTPCQAFSVAGKRLSLEDYRGNLSLAFADLAVRGGYEWVLWENVPGVLSTADNAFGCFLGRLVGSDTPLLPGGGNKWTRAGVVSGPEFTAAWRVLDAQYFGVAQRRRRVFVLARRGAGNWSVANALFPVGEGLCGYPAPRREAGEGTTRATAPSLVSSGRGVERVGETRGQDPVVLSPEPIPFNTQVGLREHKDGDGTGLGIAEVGDPAYTLQSAHHHGVFAPVLSHDPSGRLTGRDYKGPRPETDLSTIVAEPTVMRQREGKPGGGKGPLLSANVRLTLAANANDQVLFASDVAPTLGSSGPPFSRPGNERVEVDAYPVVACVDKRTAPPSEDVSPTLKTDLAHEMGPVVVAPPLTAGNDPSRSPQSSEVTAQVAAVVSALGEISHALKAEGADGSEDGTGRGTPIVAAFDVRNITSKANRTRVEEGLPSPCLHGEAMHVIALRPRRLTPRECERLQGFPDDYTLIPWRKGMAPDSLRYKALGNSMAVPCMRYLAQRIEAVR